MKIIEARAYHLKAPLETPYQTTFGAMTHRQAVIVALTGDGGETGIGETYINFPIWSPAGRMASYREAFLPEVSGADIDDIPSFMQALWRKYYRASLQGGALGPTMQAVTAISAALWDLRAKEAGKPLGRLFSENPADRVKLYGSGINPPFPRKALTEALDTGMDVFKLKLGYGDEIDRKNIEDLKILLGGGARLAVDVNRSWSFDRALHWMPYLADNDIAWLEEPLDPVAQHRYPELVERATVPVAAGENFLLPPGTDFGHENEWGLSLNESGLAPDIIQPALAKNCCFNDGVRLKELIEPGGKKIFPHFLGSAPGLAASAQFAALTADPHLEWDINPNPLRTSLFSEPFTMADGGLELSGNPGIGWEMKKDMLETWTADIVETTRR